jgi:hypothetical protein
MRAMNVAAASNVLLARVPTEKLGASVVDRNRFDKTSPSCSLRTSPARRKLKRTIVAFPANSNQRNAFSMALLNFGRGGLHPAVLSMMDGPGEGCLAGVFRFG